MYYIDGSLRVADTMLYLDSQEAEPLYFMQDPANMSAFLHAHGVSYVFVRSMDWTGFTSAALPLLRWLGSPYFPWAAVFGKSVIFDVGFQPYPDVPPGNPIGLYGIVGLDAPQEFLGKRVLRIVQDSNTPRVSVFSPLNPEALVVRYWDSGDGRLDVNVKRAVDSTWYAIDRSQKGNTSTWRTAVFPVPRITGQSILELGLHASGSDFIVDDIEVKPITEPWFAWYGAAGNETFPSETRPSAVFVYLPFLTIGQRLTVSATAGGRNLSVEVLAPVLVAHASSGLADLGDRGASSRLHDRGERNVHARDRPLVSVASGHHARRANRDQMSGARMADEPKATLPGVQILSQAFRSKDLGEPLTRVGFLFVAYILTHVAVSDAYSFPIFTNLPLLIMNLGAYAFAFTLIVLALVSKSDLRPKAYLVLIAAAYAVLLNFVPVVVFQPFYRIDSISYTHYSAVLLIQGRNPYAESMLPSLSAFHVPADAWSPLEGGGLFGTSPYPPLAFLVYVPILALGATDVRIVYLAFHLAGLGILYLRAPPAFRGIAPIGLVMTLELVQYTPWGVPDILWVVPGLLMATDLGRPARAGLWYGIACAFKQTPWLLAPFLFLWYWHRHRGDVRTTLVAFGGVAAGAFLLVNAPFVAWNPSAWAAAMFAPLTSLQAPTGLGLSTLAAYGYVFVRRDLFVVAEVGLLAVLAVGYHVHFERLEFTLWIFPALVLFVSYRMLQSYVVYWAPFLVVGLWMWWRTHANSNP